MSIEEKQRELNFNLKHYLRYLVKYNSFLVDEITYFACLNSIYKSNCERFHIDMCAIRFDLMIDALSKNVPITTSLAYAKAYFHDTYNGLYDEEIEKMITDGTIMIFYRDKETDEKHIEELNKEIADLKAEEKEYDLKLDVLDFRVGDFEKEKEELETEKQLIKTKIVHLMQEIRSYNGASTNTKAHAIINLACDGTIYDACNIIHEIRHQLNNPLKESNTIRNISTESISIFETLNCLDYFQKFYSLEELRIIRTYLIASIYPNCKNFDLTSFLVYLYNKYDSISFDSYKLSTGIDDVKVYEEELLDKDATFDIEQDYLYIFGIIIASYMHQKVKENPEFLSKVIEFNSKIKENPTIDSNEAFFDFFNIIGLDIKDEGLLEEYLIKEFKWLRSLYEENITR